ncbi:MAG TPA: hypothetical protein VKY31_11240 [Terriglobia bacterium]|nr:hypothetical protein [Terriglobia bacterium]
MLSVQKILILINLYKIRLEVIHPGKRPLHAINKVVKLLSLR